MDSDLNPDSSPVLPIELIIIGKGMQHFLVVRCKRPKIACSAVFLRIVTGLLAGILGDLWF
jgi:hypothetical protein